MTSVATLRDLNNRYARIWLRCVLVCPKCEGRFTGDLARYQCPRDVEYFLCPHCDRDLGLRFEDGGNALLPKAQRLAA